MEKTFLHYFWLLTAFILAPNTFISCSSNDTDELFDGLEFETKSSVRKTRSFDAGKIFEGSKEYIIEGVPRIRLAVSWTEGYTYNCDSQSVISVYPFLAEPYVGAVYPTSPFYRWLDNNTIRVNMGFNGRFSEEGQSEDMAIEIPVRTYDIHI
ncbi:MAG: hypothetical protein IJ209_05165 [Bacteroidaceae bacterium]|nr:hypothetical protein [Bacteroidaceae bacterium]